MTASQPNLLELAKQGDARAIAALMNRQLQPKGVTAKATLKDGCLQVVLEAAQVPNQQALVPFICKGVTGLEIESVERIKIYGRQTNQEESAWIQEFELAGRFHSNTSPTNLSSASAEETKLPNLLQVSNGKPKQHTSEISSPLAKTKYASHQTTMAVFYFAGIALIICALLSPSDITWLIVLAVSAFLIAISTPQGQALIIKNSQDSQKLNEKMNRDMESMTERNKEAQKDNLSAKELLSSNEQIIFHQMASYRGGVKGYPNSSKNAGLAYVLDQSFVFHDSLIAFKLPHDRIIEAKLDFFQMGGTRGFLASGDVGRQLQQTKNTLDLYYLDEEGTERNAKFQIHGAATIYGEAGRATEFLNQLLEFKGSFLDRSQNNQSDPISKLEKLKKLKEQGIITDSEFETKKKQLLDQL